MHILVIILGSQFSQFGRMVGDGTKHDAPRVTINDF